MQVIKIYQNHIRIADSMAILFFVFLTISGNGLPEKSRPTLLVSIVGTSKMSTANLVTIILLLRKMLAHDRIRGLLSLQRIGLGFGQ